MYFQKQSNGASRPRLFTREIDPMCVMSQITTKRMSVKPWAARYGWDFTNHFTA